MVETAPSDVVGGKVTATTAKSTSHQRDRFASQLGFLLTCVGYAVGLGNLWRFPALAYENGGGAFLIPYILSSIFFGFPLLYLELAIGQFTQRGAGKAFKYFAPAAHGLGWCMAVVSLVVGVYYNLIVAWSLLFLYITVSGRSSDWASCRNEWNTPACSSPLEDERCARQNTSTPYYYNMTCWAESLQHDHTNQVRSGTRLPPMGPAEEFFERWMCEKSSGIDEWGGLNERLLLANSIAWILTGLCLCKGAKWMGRIATVTASLPYAIVIALFVRAISLDGASIGVDFFLRRPDFQYLARMETWRQAATQVCYTLGIGFGGLLSLASFNKRQHNVFRDAIVVTTSDAMMSVFGGATVFCTMGFMAKQMKQPIGEVIQSGVSLAFVVYPEAMSRMPFTWVWSLLFFLMFALLGVSSQFAMSEVAISAFTDQFPRLRPYRTAVVALVCLVSFVVALPLCTGAGIYWFSLYNEFAGSFVLIIFSLLEIIVVMHLYGSRNWMDDLRWMMGGPRSTLAEWVGASGHLWRGVWLVLSPVLLLVILAASIVDYADGYVLTYGRGPRTYTFPAWAMTVGWFIVFLQVIAIPIFFIFNYLEMRGKGGWRELFRVQPSLPSYDRIRQRLAAVAARRQREAGGNNNAQHGVQQ